MGMTELTKIQAFYDTKWADFKSEMESLTAAGKNSDAQIAEQKMMHAKKKADEIGALISEIRKSEEASGNIQIIQED
jgi:hypothetical protein